MRVASLGFAFAAMFGVVAFATLGSWQLGRAQQKRDWLQQQQRALVAPPSALAEALDAAADAPIAAVAGRGRYVAPLWLLDNQQRDGRVGVRAYALAEVAGREALALVELGWLPWSPQRTLPPLRLPDGERELRGLWTAWPGQGLRAAQNPEPRAAESAALLNYLERAELERWSGRAIAPRVLKLAPDIGDGWQRDATLLPNTLPPERHVGYAVQWFALAASVAIVYLVLLLRHRRRTSR